MEQTETKLYSISSANFLLGCVLNNPKLLLSGKYNLEGEDFSGFLFNRVIFFAIRKLLEKGVTEIDEIILDGFLKNYEEYYEVANDNNFLENIPILKQLSLEGGIDYHYDIVKKFSTLRYYKENGCDIKEFFDESKDYESQMIILDKCKIEDIINYYEKINAEAKKKFIIEKDNTTEKQAGENGKEILQNFKNCPLFGLSFESKYLTALWGGFRKQQLYIRSGDTSSGKSRSVLADLACVCVDEIYNIQNKKWEKNPNGKNKGLYIGCEMTLDEEVDPILWSYVSGITSHKITDGILSIEEEERVNKAIEIVNDNCLWIVDMPSFNIQKIRDKVSKYKIMHQIDFVAFDYMLLNSDLVKEFVVNRGGISGGTREDQILLELSKSLKDICKDFDVGLITSTQVNGDIADYRNRDYRVLRGGKAVADKATGGSISMPITKQELDLISPYLQKRGFSQHSEPNFVETVYKSRFSKYPKECKIFSYYDLGNMRRYEMFVTDKFFRPIDIKKTVVIKNEESGE